MADTRQGHRARLRAKYLHAGLEGLHDYEIVELLLTFAHPRKDTKALAKKLIARYKNIPNLLDAPAAELAEIEGAGETTTTLFGLVRDLLEIYLKDKLILNDCQYIDSLPKVLDFLKSSLRHEQNEVFKVLFLDAQNRLIYEDNQQKGTVNRSAVYPRSIMEDALEKRAVSLIFAHNHPGGTPYPSRDDKTVTKKLVQAASLFDISVLDHVIIAGDQYFSFAEQELL